MLLNILLLPMLFKVEILCIFFLLPLYGGRTSAKIKRAETLWTGEKIIRNLNT
jgi:hypothetical protein